MLNLIKELQHSFEVNEDGKLVWQRDAASNVDEGDIAGYVSREGYYRVQFYGLEYNAARVIWAITYGDWPKGRLRYKDGNSANTRLSNLELK